MSARKKLKEMKKLLGEVLYLAEPHGNECDGNEELAARIKMAINYKEPTPLPKLPHVCPATGFCMHHWGEAFIKYLPEYLNSFKANTDEITLITK